MRWIVFAVTAFVVACQPAVSTRSCNDGDCSDASEVTCGPGTHLVDDECLPDEQSDCTTDGGCQTSTTTCGLGTHLEGNECVPDGSVGCGSGTKLIDGLCQVQSGALYALRIDTTTIPADGHTSIPVYAIGINPDGTMATDEVVLSVSRPNAGSLTPVTFHLDPKQASSSFLPCNSVQTPSCLGSFQIQLALASDPTHPIVSTRPLQLVAVPAVGSPDVCLGGGNTLYLSGEHGDYIHPGSELLQTGSFSVQFSPSDAPDWISIWWEDWGAGGSGDWWGLDFSTQELGTPMATDIYTNAQRAAFADPGHPGIDISGSGRGCNTITGRFQVHDLQVVSGELKSFTATFEQHCEGGPAALTGCVHFEQ